MQSRNTQFDSQWDNTKDLKSNLTALFTNLPEIIKKLPGFFNRNDYIDMDYHRTVNRRNNIDMTLKANNSTLEDVYVAFCIAANMEVIHPGKDDAFMQRVAYAIEKIETESPSIIFFKDKVKAECDRAVKHGVLVSLERIFSVNEKSNLCSHP